MRFLGALILALILAASARAQVSGVGRIAIFSDEALTDSTLVDSSSRIVDIYIAHVDCFGGVTGSEFKTQPDGGFAGVWLNETSPWWPYVLGTSPEGVSIAYASCVTADIFLIKAVYWLPGISSPCSGLSVVGHPDRNGYMVCTGCNFVDLPCDAPGSLRVNCPVPVEETTWGRVKALYRD